MATVMGGSFASPSADADPLAVTASHNGLVGQVLNMSGWSIALSMLLMLLAYDQCMCSMLDHFHDRCLL